MNNLFGTLETKAGMGLLTHRKRIDTNDGIPAQVMQAIKKMKKASPEKKQAFVQQIVQTIQNAPGKTPEAKNAVMEKFMRAMS